MLADIGKGLVMSQNSVISVQYIFLVSGWNYYGGINIQIVKIFGIDIESLI